MIAHAHNLNSHLLGTSEFSFAEGAATAAAAKLIGFRDFGNMVSFSVQPENTKVEHKGSYRGTKRTDKTRVTESKLMYQLKMDEWTMQNLLFLTYGSSAGNFTQTIKSGVSGDGWNFASGSTFNLGYWYDLDISGVRVRNATALIVSPNASAVAAQGESDDSKFTATAHGLDNGDTIQFIATGGIEAIALATTYFIVNKDTNTFQVALTAGGTPITLATDGTGTTFKQVLKSSTDYELDAEVGRVRFLTAQTEHLYATITAPAILTTDAAAMRLITPLTTTKRSGIGRLLVFDDKATNQVAMTHVDFGCDISLTGNVEGGGDNYSEFTLEVLVTDPVGTVEARELAAGTA